MAFDKLNALLELPVYGLRLEERSAPFLDALREVAAHHYSHCEPYRRLCEKRGFVPDTLRTVAEVPYLPTAVFKDALLLSIPPEAVYREIRSSATSSGQSSRVGIDKETSRRQTKCFNKVAVDRIGRERRRFVILDTPATIGRSAVASARSSTIRSLLFCASEAVPCMREDGDRLWLEKELLDAELRGAEQRREPIVIFGFTYVLYRHAIRFLLDEGRRYVLPGSKVLHIGGWKKLEAEKVSPEKLVEDCAQAFGVSPGDVVDFYGFTEQSGLIYPTCEQGVRHAPVWGEVIVRDPVSLAPVPSGTEGLLQFVSPIQTAYPGHSVLTDDVGVILGVDDCPCGRMGTCFKVVGRAPRAEVRGCGDIMAEKIG